MNLMFCLLCVSYTFHCPNFLFTIVTLSFTPETVWGFIAIKSSAPDTTHNTRLGAREAHLDVSFHFKRWGKSQTIARSSCKDEQTAKSIS